MRYSNVPVLPFDTNDPVFARGFEAGRIWAILSSDGPSALADQPIHAENAEMVLRMGEALGYDLQAEFTDDPAWMVLV